MLVNQWQVRITVPVAVHGWLTSNNRKEHMAQGRRVKAYRRAAADAGRRAGLPMEVSGVSLHFDCYYVTAAPPVRDHLNMEPTIKALTDGLGPEQGFLRQGRSMWNPGCGFLIDDSDKHVLAQTWDLIRDPAPGAVPYVILTIRRENAT
jgi:hypothetical protein